MTFRRKTFVTVLVIALACMFVSPALARQDKEKKEKVLQSAYGTKTAMSKSYVLLNKVDSKMVVAKTVDLTSVIQADQQAIGDLNGYGPGPEVWRLDEQITFVDYNRFGLDPRRVSNYSMRIYPDANPSSNIYYYLPDRYFIDWTPDDGYYMSIDYKPQRDENEKTVEIGARLTPTVGLGYGDYNLLKKLLLFYLKSAGKPYADIQLRPIPATYKPSFDLSADGITEDDIALTGVDPDTRELAISISTDLLTKEVLVGKLSGLVGITGSMQIEPVQVSDKQTRLPPITFAESNLRFCDSEAYARTYWVRDSGDHTIFRNRHPFEINLKYLVYLYPVGNRIEVRGYDLGPIQMKPGDIAKIPNDSIHEQIDDAKTIAAWYEYSFECSEDALSAVVDSVTGGVGALSVMKLSIEAVEAERLFEDYQVYKLVVTLSSPYLDPKGEETLQQSYELSATEPRVEVQLYLRGDARKDASLYRYKITVVTTGGSIYQDDSWHDANEFLPETIFIGADQIEELISR